MTIDQLILSFLDPDSSKTAIDPAVVAGTLCAFAIVVIVAFVIYRRWKPKEGKVSDIEQENMVFLEYLS